MPVENRVLGVSEPENRAEVSNVNSFSPTAIRAYVESVLRTEIGLSDVEKLDSRMNLFQLGLDSMNGLFLLEGIENTFGIKLSYEDVLNNPTIDDLVELINEC